MRKKIAGVIDFETGNQNAVKRIFESLNYKVNISHERSKLENSDILILPGVGSFPTAMKNLHKYNLVDFLRLWHNRNKNLIGICLGMQLLCEKSYEHGETVGLGIIPGEILPFKSLKWHIGWNKIEYSNTEINDNSENSMFFFNHSYYYKGPKKFIKAFFNFNKKYPAIISYKNSIGIQFHPEKSQTSGHEFLESLL